jgi:CheY-like chemotaxis protein
MRACVVSLWASKHYVSWKQLILRFLAISRRFASIGTGSMLGSTIESSRIASSVSPSPCCLIVEDQMLIAMSIEAYLEDVGYHAAGPFTSGSEALEWLQSHKPHAAILDFSLKDGDCVELAHELLQRDIPFVVYSGHPRRPDMPCEFKDVPWIQKPCAREDMLAALRGMA